MAYEENNRNGIPRFQSIMHLCMGLVYIVFGLLVVYVKYFGTMQLPAGVAYTLGGIMIIYGIFRIWRGFAAFKQRKRSD